MQTNLYTKNKLQTFTLFILLLLLLWVTWILAKDWLRPNIIKLLGGFTKSEVQMTRDTLSVKYNDIYVKYKEVVTKATEISKPEYITKYRYLPQPNTKNISTTGNSQPQYVEIEAVKRYNTAVNDSILDGNIETIIDIDSCKLVTQTLTYKPKIPYIREKIITIVETKETILSQEAKAYIGIGTDVNTLNIITPKVYYLTKKKWLLNAGYSKSFDPIYPDSFTVGIAKLF
jgi:hypothetical protein